MMADRVQGEGSNGGRSGNQERRRPSVTANAHARAYDHARAYAHVRAYVSLAVKASGLVALLLSTVILLGGYVQSLGKNDFYCIVAITVIQAAGIFQDWENNVQYVEDFWETLMVLKSQINNLMSKFSVKGILVLVYIAAPVVWSFTVLLHCLMLSYAFGPLACAGISSWRIAKLNHDNNRDVNMMRTMKIFYSLIIFQGTMSLVYLLPINYIYRPFVVRRLLALELSKKWGEQAIRRYMTDICARCRKDPPSIKGMDLIKFAAELLDSESQKAYLYGARLLSAFVNKGEDVSWVLLPSRHRIQRLIDSLMISSSSLDEEDCVPFRRRSSKICYALRRCSSKICYALRRRSSKQICYAVIGGIDDKKEIRELAATIVADVASHIDDLSNYPGAMQCISSMLQDQEETAHTYTNRMRIGNEERRHIKLMEDQKRVEMREHGHWNKREGGTSNKLVQQGLTILERLASSSDDNRRLICGAPGLLPKITAPLYSETLIEDIKTKAWADIVTRCLNVLYQLIRVPDCSHEMFSNNVQALRNLKIILELSNNETDHQELQLVAMEILTELALGLSINLTEETKKVLIAKQLQLFLFDNGDDEEQSAAIAGRAMISLSTNSEGYSALIMTMENEIIGRLTGILDDDENITRRTIGAEIMANLCAHCNVDSMKEILPKVLREIIKSQEREQSGGQNNPASGDEENQGTHSIATDGDDTDIMEISDQEREEQEAFLSLAQVICDKLDSADLDGAIKSAFDQNNAGTEEQRREAFVDKLKTIIDDNSHAIPDCLRIVKLCGRIAKSVMRCEQYFVIFRNKGFKSSLSEASKTMSELESCMLFVGTDFGLKKTVRPLLSSKDSNPSLIKHLLSFSKHLLLHRTPS